MNQNVEKMIAKDLLSISAVFLRPDEPFTWASGIKSPIYCDNRLTLTAPAVRTDVETALLAPDAFPCILIGPDGTSTSLCSTDGLLDVGLARGRGEGGGEGGRVVRDTIPDDAVVSRPDSQRSEPLVRGVDPVLPPVGDIGVDEAGDRGLVDPRLLPLGVHGASWLAVVAAEDHDGPAGPLAPHTGAHDEPGHERVRGDR